MKELKQQIIAILIKHQSKEVNSETYETTGNVSISSDDYTYVADFRFKRMNDFEPLTVEMVLKWYGWFLWQLENSKLLNETPTKD